MVFGPASRFNRIAPRGALFSLEPPYSVLATSGQCRSRMPTLTAVQTNDHSVRTASIPRRRNRRTPSTCLIRGFQGHHAHSWSEKVSGTFVPHGCGPENGTAFFPVIGGPEKRQKPQAHHA